MFRWVGLVGQLRPKKLIAPIDKDGPESQAYKDIPKRLLDKSLYSVALCSQLSVTPTTSVFLSTEGQGDKKKRSTKAMLFHKASTSPNLTNILCDYVYTLCVFAFLLDILFFVKELCYKFLILLYDPFFLFMFLLTPSGPTLPH